MASQQQRPGELPRQGAFHHRGDLALSLGTTLLATILSYSSETGESQGSPATCSPTAEHEACQELHGGKAEPAFSSFLWLVNRSPFLVRSAMILLITTMCFQVSIQGFLICLALYKAIRAIVAPGGGVGRRGRKVCTESPLPPGSFYSMGTCSTSSLTELTQS